MLRIWTSTALATVWSAGMIAALACGKTGPLRPPAPRGPHPPGTVESRQLGSGVEVAFTVPSASGAQPSRQIARTEILRVEFPRGVPPSRDPEAFRIRGEVVATVDADAGKSGARLVIPDLTVERLADAGVGWTLRYGVRVRDRRDRPSPLVVAQDLPVVEAVDAPRTLAAHASADGIRLSWAAPDAGGEDRAYNVYRGPVESTLGERPVNLKPVTSHEYLDATVESGKVYRYVVRAVAAPAPPFRESVSSPAVVVDASDRFAPAAPTGLVAVQEGRAVRLLWDPGTEPDLDGYRVYRSVGDGPWEALGEVVRQASFLDTAVEPGMVVRYRVSAVDRAAPPNESEPSSTVEQTVAVEPPDAP